VEGSDARSLLDVTAGQENPAGISEPQVTHLEQSDP